MRCATCEAEAGPGPICPRCGADPNRNRIVGGKFRVEERFGRGGMSSVYRGVHVVLGEPVAIKFLRPELAADPALRERFRREAVALSRLRHPAIVSILDYGDAESEPYVVMELVRGVEIDELEGAGKRLPVLRAGPVLDQLLAALETCHAAGIVHRDIKPANVLVTSEGDYVKLIDFGLARTQGIGTEKLTLTGIIQGTPNYMAPEQCRGEEVDAPADIYAFGVMTYELLTGERAYHASDIATYMAQHMFVEPPPMREVFPGVSAGIADIVHRAMAKAPALRPTARELRHALAAALRGTDPHSIAEANAVERRRQGALPRDERALTGRLAQEEAIASPVAGNVLAWMPRDERTAALRGALGAVGLPVSSFDREELPASLATGTVVIVSARHGGSERVGRVRAIHGSTPVVVVDVAGIDEMSALIRGGASDIALEGAPDAELGGKVKRLVRRQSRARGGRE